MAINVRSELEVTKETSSKSVVVTMDLDDARAISEILARADFDLFNYQWAEAIESLSDALLKASGGAS